MKKIDLFKTGKRMNKLEDADNIRIKTTRNKINMRSKNRLSHNIRKYIVHRAIIRREPSVSIHFNKVK